MGRRDLSSKPKSGGENSRRALDAILLRQRVTVGTYFHQAADDYAANESDTSIEMSVTVYTKGGILPSYVMRAIKVDRVAPRTRHYARSRDVRDARHV